MKYLRFFVFMVAALFAFSVHAAGDMDFELPDVAGTQFIKLSKLPPKPTVIYFWSNGCGPCIAELQWLSGLAEKHPEIRFIGISIDKRDEVIKQLMKTPLSFTTVLAPADPRPLLKRFGDTTGGIPYSIMLNADRSACWANLGELDRTNFEAGFITCLQKQL